MKSEISFDLELESELLKLWKKFLKRSDITIDDDFFESGGDSLLAEELLLEVQHLTQAMVPPSLLLETGTVRRLAERLGRTEKLTPQPAVRIGGADGRLFHFFHGDFTHGGVSARRIAAMLGPDRPTLAIAPHGMHGEPLPASIEDMAADRLPVILEAQPCGPYLLGGHCAGALVAFETARLLVNAGHRVDLVVMIDPVVTSLRASARRLLLAQDFVKRAMGRPPDQASLERTWKWFVSEEARLRKLLAELRHRIVRKEFSPRTKLAKSPIRNDPEVMEDYARVILKYRPNRLDVPVLYLALKYSARGWRGMSREMELIDSPLVDHQLRMDAATAVIAHVQRRLDALTLTWN